VSDGFIKWYRGRSDGLNFARQEELFGGIGLSLAHPTRGVEVVLDVDGNDVELSRGKVIDLLNMRLGSINIEWWFSPDVNLVCNYAYEPLGLEIQTYYLDGLLRTELEALAHLLLSTAKSSDFGTRGIVIDRHGSTAEFDWDKVLLYGSPEISDFPDFVIVPKDLSRKLSPLPPELSISPVSVDSDLMIIESRTA
jgi:hypothetical protein